MLKTEQVPIIHIARDILTVVTIHEQSWDEDHGCYGTTIEQVANRIAGDDYARATPESTLIVLLLRAAWNDAQDWAKEVLR